MFELRDPPCDGGFNPLLEIASRAGFVLHDAVRRGILFVTGTDTGVGKTVLSALLVHALREKGWPAAGLKPVCSGGREDARLIQKAQRNSLSLDQINPWHFRAAIAPMLAAKSEGRRVRLKDVIDHTRRVQKEFPLIVMEGAGGLLSPIGADFDSRDLILSLNAIPLIVCPNRLGAMNQVLLVLEALPARFARKAQVILMAGEKPDRSGKGNVEWLRKRIDVDRVHEFPWIQRLNLNEAGRQGRACEALNRIVAAIGFD